MTSLRLSLPLIFAAQVLTAQRVGIPTDDLDKVPVEELFSVEVTSVGRKAQQLSKAPAAVFVVSAEDIRRSGATSIPEALQWVPGLTVLRIDGRNWAISARGSARLYANKMLVMIDGRSLYTPLFAGVIWDAIDVPMENIERIEIVRGPGAVMWGPNAVNGVINIITKRSRSTRGGVVSASTGSALRGSALAQWGGALNGRTDFRVWGKGDLRVPGYSSPGYFIPSNLDLHVDPNVRDLDASSLRTGFRMDTRISERSELLIQGDAYKTGRQDPVARIIVRPDLIERTQGHSDYEGGFLQARWTRTRSADDESTWQFTYDKEELSYPYFGADTNNLNIDYQRRRLTNERNEIYWGAGFQNYWDSTYSSAVISFLPSSSAYHAGNVVARDEFQLAPGRLLASAGVRVDYSNYSRFEFQPSFRLLYTPDRRQSAWLAWSRAVRVPSRYDRDIQSDAGVQFVEGIPLNAQMIGSHATRSEVERSAEAGYRFQSGQRWSVDASVFWNLHEHIRAVQFPGQFELDLTSGVPRLLADVKQVSAATGRSYGGEVWATWQVRNGWRLSPSYSYLDEIRWLPDGPAGAYFWDGEVASIRHQGILRSQHDLSRNLQFDVLLRARSRNPRFQLPGGFLADAHLTWRPVRGTELSLGGQDLTNRRQVETYSEGPFVAIPSRRTFVIQWTQRF